MRVRLIQEEPICRALPPIAGVDVHFRRFGADGGRIEEEISPLKRHRARRLGEPLIPADCDTESARGGLPELTTIGIAISWNIVKELRPGISASRAVNISRAAIVAWVAVAYWLATLNLPLLAKIGVWTYEGIVHLVPPIVFGLFWRKGNKYGAGLGLVAGLTVTYGINLTMAQSFGNPAIMGFTGAIVGLIVNVVGFVAGAYLWEDVDYAADLFSEIGEFDGEELDVESRDRVLDQYRPLSTAEDD